MPADWLSPEEREEIRSGLTRQESFREIARTLGRAPTTVSREVTRNGGCERYRAVAAQRRAEQCRGRPKTPKLMIDPVLARAVTRDLRSGYSPAGIAVRLREAGGATVSHETIYRAVYSPTFAGIGLRGQDCLRMRRRRRRHRHGPVPARRHRQFGDFKLIELRPPGAADRSEIGHWEGDLIIGAHHASAVVTLVERVSRLTLLAALPHRRTTADVRAALGGAFAAVPRHLRCSLTWDQGIEMTDWRGIEAATEMDVFFCHPHSPWERPSNEHTNRQLRYWLPKGTDLSVHGPAQLDRIAGVLNTLPRRLLAWKTPQYIYDHHALR